MKKTAVALAISIIGGYTFASDPIYVAPTPVIKRVCIKNAKTGKQTCKMVKTHKKLKGTPVPKMHK